MPQKCVFRGSDDLSAIFGPPVHQDPETDDSESESEVETESEELTESEAESEVEAEAEAQSEAESDGRTESADSSQAGSDNPTEASNARNESPASTHQRPEGGQPTRDDTGPSTAMLDDNSQQPNNQAGSHADVEATQQPEGGAASGNIDVPVNVNEAAPSSSGFAAGGAANDHEDLETVARNAIAALNDTTNPNLPRSSASNQER